MRAIGVGVAGLGTVGREAVRLLRANRAKFQARLGADVVLTAVADRAVEREAAALGLPAAIKRARRAQDLARLPGVDVVVELIGGLEDARRLALASLRAGRHVVTANKRLLSHCWPELRRAAAEGRARLYFEASVAGGIPVLSALDNNLAANRIEAVYGILNGTTNYILTRAEEGLTPAQALAEAQSLGLAEKDPTFDLDGTDAVHKVSVLACLLTGAWIDPLTIPRSGIQSVSAADVEFARAELGATVRLLGCLRLGGAGRVEVSAHVAPTIVPLEHPLAGVRGEHNALLIKASAAGELMLYGKGAGGAPTASAVVGDVYMLSRDILGRIPPAPLPAARARLARAGSSVSAFYLRLHAADRPGVLAEVARALARHEVSIARIHQSERSDKAGVPIFIVTHPTLESRFSAAAAAIAALKSTKGKPCVMRVLA